LNLVLSLLMKLGDLGIIGGSDLLPRMVLKLRGEV
jgi:hypothetical protein